MAEIEINGQKTEAQPGSMIIEAADKAGVWIPRFCYHEKLSIAANCRMCLVDVDKSPKPLPACATPITDGMKVWTRSAKALSAQKAVMEFLLINHPLDCPICDQGGECELQDIALGYGSDVSRFTEGKRSIKDKDIGPLIATDMTRCIHCTRCVRFGTEVAGIRELGATGRGEHMEIGTFVEHSIESEVSGNMIDLCPVGALTSKPYRFKARGWELSQFPSIAPHDCLGSNIFVHVRRQEVMRVVPRENEAINEVWISDRDRFSYEGLYQDRVQGPLIKKQGQWQSVDWSEALSWTCEKLKDICKQAGPKALGALASPNSTLEEFYLLQKLMRGLGSNHIDHRLRQLDFRDQETFPIFPTLGIPLANVERQAAILLMGSDIRSEQPLLALKFRKMVLSGGKMLMVNPLDFPMNFEVAEKIIVEGGDLCRGVSEIAKALSELNQPSGRLPKEGEHWLAGITPSSGARTMAQLLAENPDSLVLIGALGLNSPQASQLIALGKFISRCVGGKLGLLTEGANATGGWLAGCLPHRLSGGQRAQEPGFTAVEMSRHLLSGMVLMNLDPELDSAAGLDSLETLRKTPFVVALTPFYSETLKEVAQAILPIVPFTENAGTYINVEGRWQSFSEAVKPLEASRPAWKVLQVLGEKLGLKGFEYGSVQAVLADLKHLESIEQEGEGSAWTGESFKALNFFPSHQITRIAPVPRYASDNVVRRASALQKVQGDLGDKVAINPVLARELGVQSDQRLRVVIEGREIRCKASVDDRLPDRVVMVPLALQASLPWGTAYQAVEIYREEEDK